MRRTVTIELSRDLTQRDGGWNRMVGELLALYGEHMKFGQGAAFDETLDFGPLGTIRISTVESGTFKSGSPRPIADFGNAP